MAELSEFHCCHFTWQIPNQSLRRNRFLRDRIYTIEEEVKSQNEGKSKKRNYPQLLSLQAFLNVMLYRNKNEDEDENEDRLLENAESCLNQALKECNSISKEDEDEANGYRLVIYADFIHLHQYQPNENVEDYKEAYNDLISQGLSGDEHPSVLAMKGFTAGHLDFLQDAIMWYQRALETMEKAEWLFGLALAKLQLDYWRSKPTNNVGIQNLLQQAIKLDPTYDMARIKLARCLLDQHKKSNQNGAHLPQMLVMQIKDLVDPIQTSNDHNGIGLNILEEIGSVYSRMDNFLDKGLRLSKECRRRNPESMKALRCLANAYFHKWKSSRNESELKNSVKYFSQIISDLENSKMYDITMLGVVHLNASNFYLEKDGVKAQHHKAEWKICFEKVEELFHQGQLEVKEEIEMCHRLAWFYSDLRKPLKEREYWQKVLDINDKALREGIRDFQESSYVKNAQEKLSEFQ
ncbi:uncharacterized protein [Clytia hemisphaerica]|uniref:uncharacterized protein n=1 Tax=Clytia hemisphaerica TaxID=252671 RepID=UPI0034D3EEE4